jgi:hypothetical protein
MTSFNRESLAIRKTMNKLLQLPEVNRKLAMDISAFGVSYPTPVLPDMSVTAEWTGKRLRDESLRLSDGSVTTVYAHLQSGSWVDLRLQKDMFSIVPEGVALNWIKPVHATPIDAGSHLHDLGAILIRPDGHVGSVALRTDNSNGQP